MNPTVPQIRTFSVLGTPLRATTYADLTEELQLRARHGPALAVDFTNTHIVTLRRHDPQFRQVTDCFEYFVPDGMPLIWCLNLQGARMRDRVYGPTFMRHCVLSTPAPFTHYFLGGSEECGGKLKSEFLARNSELKIVGVHSGYFNAAQEPQILEEINRLSPDFIWVGLGTPKQQAWVNTYKPRITRGVILAVGFAFDVNAGMKPDAPLWMQRLGLTWLFRLLSEPRRLAPRYFYFNALFILYLLWDSLCGRPWRGTTAIDKVAADVRRRT